MIGLYGAMLDSWVVGLPWAVGTLLVWQWDRGGRRVGGPVIAAVTAGTVLSCWPGALLVAAIVGVDGLGALGGRSWSRPARLRTLVAVATLAAVGLWITWAAGSVGAPGSTFPVSQRRGTDLLGRHGC